MAPNAVEAPPPALLRSSATVGATIATGLVKGSAARLTEIAHRGVLGLDPERCSNRSWVVSDNLFDPRTVLLKHMMLHMKISHLKIFWKLNLRLQHRESRSSFCLRNKQTNKQTLDAKHFHNNRGKTLPDKRRFGFTRTPRESAGLLVV